MATSSAGVRLNGVTTLEGAGEAGVALDLSIIGTESASAIATADTRTAGIDATLGPSAAVAVTSADDGAITLVPAIDQFRECLTWWVGDRRRDWASSDLARRAICAICAISLSYSLVDLRIEGPTVMTRTGRGDDFCLGLLGVSGHSGSY